MSCFSSMLDYIAPGLYIIFGILFSLITAYGIYKYIEYHKACDATSKPNKRLFIIGLIFLTISSIYMLCFSIVYIYLLVECIQSPMTETSQSDNPNLIGWFLSNICYYAHVYLLWLILFIRLSLVFNGTVYQLSNCVNKMYKTLLILLPIVIPTFLILSVAFGIIVVAIFYMFSIAFSLSLSILFVTKLNNMHKKTQDADEFNETLLDIITKNTILCVISTLFTVFVLFSSLIYIKLFPILTLLDMFSNAVCIMFTYKFSEKDYYLLCGSIDEYVKLFIARRNLQTHVNAHHVNSMPSNSSVVPVDENVEI